MQYFYVPEYNENTSIKKGECPPHETLSARQQLIRESGGHCVGEKWKANKGYVPLYEFNKQLSKDEMDVLCLCGDA